jgi:AraC-like DNA-binding protein
VPRSVASVFGNPDDFQAALRADGVLSLLVIGRGQFRARLTQVELNHLRLAAGEEELSRIAFVAVPADTVVVSLPIGDRPAPIWGGMRMQAHEMITLAPGQRVYARTDGPCRWGSIGLPGDDLARYGRALTGTDFAVPPVARWRPPRAALRQLRHFHRAATRAAEMRSRVLADNQAADGLKQQLIHALVECLSARSVDEEPEAARRHRDILARFEDLLQDRPAPDIAQICAALGISERTLCQCCKEHLGMGPGDYRSLRRRTIALT